MKLKILSVGLSLPDKEIENASFYDPLSFSDFDVLMIDPKNIPEIWEGKIPPRNDGTLWVDARSDSGFSKELKELMDRRAKEVRLLLEYTGGIVVCFLRGKGVGLDCYFREREYTMEANIYNWLPGTTFTYTSKDPMYLFKTEMQRRKVSYTFSHYSFNPEKRFGREIGEIHKGHPFSQYFFGLKDKIYFEAVISDTGLLECSKHIAKNKVGEVIALEIPIGKGKFVLIPPFDDSADMKKVSGVLVDCIRKSLEWSVPLAKPDWLKNYSLPGEEQVSKKMDSLNDELKKLNEKKEKIQTQIDEIEILKGLLYETGRYGLEPPVRKAFSIIGFDVKDPGEYDKPYDLLAIEGDTFIIGEIEGSKAQVDVDKYRQLLDYVTEATIEGKGCKGILIGNGFVDSEPSKRKEQFTEQVIRGCDSQRYCRMTTTELYKAVYSILSQPSDTKTKNLIKDSILNCEGEFKFDVNILGI